MTHYIGNGTVSDDQATNFFVIVNVRKRKATGPLWPVLDTRYRIPLVGLPEVERKE